MKNEVLGTALAAKFNGLVTMGKGVRRITSDSEEGRRFISQTKHYKEYSNHTPHIGIKQRHKGHKRINIIDPSCPYCRQE